jgi:hypothetical protein
MHYGVAQSPEIFCPGYAPTNTNKAIYGLGFWLSRVLFQSRFSPTHTKTLQAFLFTYNIAVCRRQSLLRCIRQHTSPYAFADDMPPT